MHFRAYSEASRDIQSAFHNIRMIESENSLAYRTTIEGVLKLSASHWQRIYNYNPHERIVNKRQKNHFPNADIISK